MPNAACSPSCQPAPRPRMKRPPVAWSRTVAALATMRRVTEGAGEDGDPDPPPGHAMGERRGGGQGLERRTTAVGGRIREVVAHPDGVDAVERAGEGPRLVGSPPVGADGAPVAAIRTPISPGRRAGGKGGGIAEPVRAQRGSPLSRSRSRSTSPSARGASAALAALDRRGFLGLEAAGDATDQPGVRVVVTR